MGKSAWGDFHAPDDGGWSDLRPGDEGYDPVIARYSLGLLDRPSLEVVHGEPKPIGIFFGPQLGWSPRREQGRTHRVAFACDLATREELVCYVCPECYSGLRGDPLGSGVVCAGCLSSSGELPFEVALR